MAKSDTTHLIALIAVALTLAACGANEYQDDDEERRRNEPACDRLSEASCAQRSDCEALYIETGCADPCGGLDGDQEEQLDCYMVEPECGEPAFDGCRELPEPPSECHTDEDCGPNQYCESNGRDHGEGNDPFVEETDCACAPCADDEDCACNCGTPAPRPSEGQCVDRASSCDSDADCSDGYQCVFDGGPSDGADCACAPCAEDQLCEPCDCGGGEGFRESEGSCQPAPPSEDCESDSDCGEGEFCILNNACTCGDECPDGVPCNPDPDPCDCGGGGFCVTD